jgi:hypothetical protein
MLFYVGFVSKGYFQHLREHLLREIVEREADYLRQRRIIAMTRSRSDSVMAVPEGRHKPRLNKSSATSPPTVLARYLAFSVHRVPCAVYPSTSKTGCICIGFHTGRASIFSASRASLTCSRSAPNSCGEIRITVNRQFNWQPSLRYCKSSFWTLQASRLSPFSYTRGISTAR